MRILERRPANQLMTPRHTGFQGMDRGDFGCGIVVEFGQQAEVGSLEELDFLGLPGILEPDEVKELLRGKNAPSCVHRV